MKTELRFLLFHPFAVNVLILYLMKTHQKTHETASLKPKTLLKATLLQGFSGVFREYKMEILARNGSIVRENLDKKKKSFFCV